MNLVRANMLSWILVTLTLFPILLVVGIYMRIVQANGLPSTQEWFYPMMTLHGLGMVGVWFTGAMACAEHVLRKYTEPSAAVSRFALVGTVTGVVLLLASVFLGRFAAGWYFLYPLPFMGSWPAWSALAFLASLTVFGASWLVWCLDLLRATAKELPLSRALGWHYLRGATEPDVPPAILITTVSLIAAVACLLAGVIVLVLFYAEILAGVHNDALLMKNLTFFFGHVLVNLSLYLGVAVIYDTLPAYCERPWKANKIVAISWNSVLAIVLLAYAHHLYMDFVQPIAFQYIGQVASYLSSLPAAVVTIFGALTLVYRSNMRWNLASGLFFSSLAGWAIGGVGAVIDSTIAVNLRFHNTLWVPAHFHTYMLHGLVLMVLGYFYHYVQQESQLRENLGRHKLIVSTFVVGGYGFLFMFYLAGANSVPRRYAVYPAELAYGAWYALVGAIFATIFLVGLFMFLGEIGRRWLRCFAAS